MYVCMYICMYVCMYVCILAIRVCAAGKGIVFKPFGLVLARLVIIENWSSIGSRLTGSFTKD